jgi:metal-responsive CopG/Arc/MetJ family transcriptional regulator
MIMPRVQTIVQLSDELLALLDERAARMQRSRSDLIREAVQEYLADDAEAEIDRRMVAAYERVPPDDIWGDALARALIAADPW